ncbi:DUF669 domain-containing protein [Kurthia gibsonii]|uniref:DUF669 domain-containing protein n=1 Tax=Kurthia gibsonii TaxID=33946 RepID=UPI002DBC56A3|nr:DUF669 domain-containing protein [Kurthia gibsonii]MEB7771447.1 DUF669 domain-containing protein [Kurthia gibsonii]
MFKIDHEKAGNEFELVAPGEYEVVVHNYEMKQSSTGKNMVVVDYEIRADVQQAHAGQKILFDNFIVSENTEWRFQAISKAAQFPQGMEFPNYKEWADTLLGKHLIVKVDHRTYNGNTYVDVKGFKESKLDAPGSVVVTDGDVPF